MKSAPSSFGPDPEIDDAAIGVEAAADTGAPAIAHIDRAGQPGLGRGHWRGVSVSGVRRGLSGSSACGAGLDWLVGAGCCAASGIKSREKDQRLIAAGSCPRNFRGSSDGKPCSSDNAASADRETPAARRRSCPWSVDAAADWRGIPGRPGALPAASASADWPSHAARGRLPQPSKRTGACSNVNGPRLSPWQLRQPGSLAAKACVIAGGYCRADCGNRRSSSRLPAACDDWASETAPRRWCGSSRTVR